MVAVAFPIDLPGRNTYVSYNFEANYALPSQSTDFTHGLYDKVLLLDGVEEEQGADDVQAGEDIASRNLKNNNFLSRKNVYQMIEEKMDVYGLNGHACLLRVICEVASSNVYDINGILGSIVHLLFT